LLQANYHGDIASFILDACHTAAIQISEKAMFKFYITVTWWILSTGLSTSEAAVTTTVTVGYNQRTFQTEEDICKRNLSYFYMTFLSSIFPVSQ